MIYGYGALVGYWQGNVEVLREDPVPLLLWPLKITQELSWDRRSAFTVRIQLLGTWAVAPSPLWKIGMGDVETENILRKLNAANRWANLSTEVVVVAVVVVVVAVVVVVVAVVVVVVVAVVADRIYQRK